MPDITLHNHGSICILIGATPKGRDWLDTHLPDDAPTWGRDGVVVEPRYVDDILMGAANDGLAIDA